MQEVRFEEETKIDEKKLRSDFQNIQKVTENQPMPAKKSKTQEFWTTLSEEKKALLKEYFKSTDKASSLYTIVKSEAEHTGERSRYFQDWQRSCGERNAYAHQIVHSFKSYEMRSIFETKGLEIVQDRAAKHEMNRETPKFDLDTKLKENLEPLLLKLFPEGPTKREKKGFRFGAKGSLAVTCTGEKTGSFYDFEQQTGGGPLQLIQKSLSCNHTEAITWAKDFLDQAPTMQVPSHFTVKKAEKEQEWISLKPDHLAPSLKELSKGLTLHYKEAARYTYHDADGTILFHTLRLENEAGKKIVLPLSFGHYKGDTEPSWSLKGYQADKKPLYNLHLLKEYPNAKVLIVEGEKTAEAASKMFPKEKMICLTWSGGAGAVEKSEWKPLFMREVVIWPDNDKAGYEASDALCKELRKTGIKSLHEVNRSTLAQELPPKWDLADPLPQGKGEGFIKDMILRAQEKAVGLNVLASHLKSNSIQTDLNVANKVLSHVEETMRPSLEQKFSLKNEIRTALLAETTLILKDAHRLKGLLGKSNFSKGIRKENDLNLHEIENRDIAVDKSKEKALER